MSRPTNSQEWAEQAPPENLEEPVAERSDGYDKDEARPSNQFNWLIRELFRWVQYFDDKFNGAQEAIEFFSDIEFNAGSASQYGDWVESQNDQNFYKPKVEHTGSGVSDLTADVFSALSRLFTDTIWTAGGDILDLKDSVGQDGAGIDLSFLRQSEADPIDVQDSGGLSGTGSFSLAELEAGVGDLIDIVDGTGSGPVGGFALSVLESGGDATNSLADLIDVDDASGNSGLGGFLLKLLQVGSGDFIDVVDENGNSGEGGFTLAQLEAGSGDVIIFYDSSGNPGLGGVGIGEIEAPGGDPIVNMNEGSASAGFRDALGYGRNQVRAHALIDNSDGSAPSIISGTGVGSVSGTGTTGQVEVQIDTDAQSTDDLHAVATCQGQNQAAVAVCDPVDINSVVVSAFDATGSRAAVPFHIHICQSSDST